MLVRNRAFKDLSASYRIFLIRFESAQNTHSGFVTSFLPIVTRRLFPASWDAVSFCSAISIALFQVVVLARAKTPRSQTVRSIAPLYRKVRSCTIDASAYEKSDSTSRISKKKKRKTWNNVFPFMGKPSKKYNGIRMKIDTYIRYTFDVLSMYFRCTVCTNTQTCYDHISNAVGKRRVWPFTIKTYSIERTCSRTSQGIADLLETFESAKERERRR